ncbi:SMP-30/gluconolactonase/LRE family protein [Amycolatopsis acidicola]|uniref:SMP-30/gluconolactonase/LRE family protein n=1 Tax=Amycolatopsis acidicola TaxID=2596893 RepID=A0A5N0VDL5_9PSEU|nr:SMP-30/gluconolactonase/LRE family protein [Amycolatopsis acidicola]KAA9164396.1 SMP-30/gluconolactonase/LRE family protein [Amycolatopsis acidicola]
MDKPELFLSGLRFPEGSRWHEGRLYFSDMHTGQVLAVHPDTAELTEVTCLDGQPSGLGWTADGALVVSSMLDNKVYKAAADGSLSIWADVSPLTSWPTNELCVSPGGHGYLGGFGYDFYHEATPQPGQLWHIAPDGSVSLGADGFTFPNGTVILPGTSTLVVAETWGHRLTAFDIGPDGALTNRREWAKLWADSTADGLTVDREHGIWISSIVEHKFVRVVEGGRITAEIDMGDELAVDCALGGADGRTLYLSTSNSWHPAETAVREGRVYRVRVEVPGPSD